MQIEDATKIKHSINGCPRYAVNHRHLLTEKEKETLSYKEGYKTAIERSRQYDGRKYDTKAHPGAVVIETYNIGFTTQRINELLNLLSNG